MFCSGFETCRSACKTWAATFLYPFLLTASASRAALSGQIRRPVALAHQQGQQATSKPGNQQRKISSKPAADQQTRSSNISAATPASEQQQQQQQQQAAGSKAAKQQSSRPAASQQQTRQPDDLDDLELSEVPELQKLLDLAFLFSLQNKRKFAIPKCTCGDLVIWLRKYTL